MLLATTRVLWPAGLNTRWYLDLNQIARNSAWAHGFMHAWALWAGLTVLAAIDVGCYLAARRSADSARLVSLAALAGLSALIALALNQPIAHAAGELRPFVAHPAAEVLVAKAHDFAFPSDHASVAGALTVGLFLFHRRGSALPCRPRRTPIHGRAAPRRSLPAG